MNIILIIKNFNFLWIFFKVIKIFTNSIMNNSINNGFEQYKHSNYQINPNLNPLDLYKSSSQFSNFQLNQYNTINPVNNLQPLNQNNIPNKSQPLALGRDWSKDPIDIPDQIQLTPQKMYNPQVVSQQLPPSQLDLYYDKPNTNFISNDPIQPNNKSQPEQRQMTPINIYNVPKNNMLSQLDLLEKDINNIFSNNISKERIEKIGSSSINNGQNYDSGSLNPPHLMMSEYPKPENIIHNNITKNVFAETLQEYSIIIDSVDRDIEKYPNPFSYRVYFNPVAGSKDASIMQKFNYVKYIKLDTGILPIKYYYVKQDTSLNNTDLFNIANFNLNTNPKNSSFNLSSYDVSGTFVIIDITDKTVGSGYKRYVRFAVPSEYPKTVDTVYELIVENDGTNNIYMANNYIARYKLQSYSIAHDKYTLLYIDEFTNPNENSTNDIVGKSFSVMFPDSCYCDVLYTSSGFVDKMYRFDNLGQINLMTINIYNSNGKLLKNSQENYTDMNSSLEKHCSCTTDTNGYFIRDYSCSCTYFRHRYYQKFQNTLIFKVGCIEGNIDKTIFS